MRNFTHITDGTTVQDFAERALNQALDNNKLHFDLLCLLEEGKITDREWLHIHSLLDPL